MKKFRSWLISRFLPAWAKESVFRENERLQAEVAALKAKVERMRAYTDGLEDGIRAQRRIVIHNEVKQ